MNKEFIDEYLINKQRRITDKRIAKFCPGVTREELFLIYNDTETPLCRNPNCSKKAMFKNFSVGYNLYCSKECSYNCPIKIEGEKATSLKNGSKAITVAKSKVTLFNKFGVTNAFNIKEVREKQLKSITKNDEWKKKRENTNKERFNHVSYAGSEDYYNNFENILKKSKETCISKYGHEFACQSEIVKTSTKNTKISNGNQIPDELLTEFEHYSRLAWSITRKQDLKKLKNYNKRGRADSKDDAYHLDHIISIKMGFMNGYTPEEIGSINNLQMLPHSMNTSKGCNSWSLINNNQRNING